MNSDHPLGRWLRELSDELAEELGVDLDGDVDVGLLLDVARDAAHQVARPAAPLTTFLVGYAAAAAGGGPERVRRAAEVATRLALRHGTPAADPNPGPDPV